MALVPRSLFTGDVSLLVPTYKSSLVQIIGQTAAPACATQQDYQTPPVKVIIINAMAFVQSRKKTPAMKKNETSKTYFYETYY